MTMQIHLKHNNILLDEWKRGFESSSWYRVCVNSKFFGEVEVYLNDIVANQWSIEFLGCLGHIEELYLATYKSYDLPRRITSIEEAKKYVDQFLVRSDNLLAFI